MNIFVLDRDPVTAARMQCDKHLVKMVLETAQLLCSAFPQGVAPYKRTHHNHPCAVWARTSLTNYAWLLVHGMALADEYTHRFGKIHKSRAVMQWCADQVIALADSLPNAGLTAFALAMPDEFKCDDPVEAYRAYYRGAKASIAKWAKGRPAPTWWAAVAV